MKDFIFLLFCVASHLSYGQNLMPEMAVPATVSRGLRPQSTGDVARNISGKYSTDEEKYRAAYNWVTTNISYDTDSAFAINAGINENAKIDEAFRRRKGVCENFAAIFNDICKKSNLKTYVVQGYTRNNTGVQNGTGHTWVAGMLGNDWFLFDPTWDAGGGEKFFMVRPKEFIQTHMPFDPIWQLLEFPVSNADFVRGVFSRSWAKSPLQYKDSIADFLRKETDLQLLDVEKRVVDAGIVNSQTRTNHAVVKMKIEMNRQEEQVNWYDTAVSLVNKATEYLNTFIEWRNKRLLLSNAHEGLDTGEMQLKNAVTFLDKIDGSKATLVLGTWHVRDRIKELEQRIWEHKKFLQENVITDYGISKQKQ